MFVLTRTYAHVVTIRVVTRLRQSGGVHSNDPYLSRAVISLAKRLHE